MTVNKECIADYPIPVTSRSLKTTVQIICCLFIFFNMFRPLAGQEKGNQPKLLFDGNNPTIQAIDAPHWGTTIECLSCHALHESPGGQLTAVAGNANLCMSCHNPTGQAGAKPFVAADKAVPGTSGTSHAWDVAADNPTHGAALPANPDISRQIINGQIICSTCHDQHKQTFQPFLRADNTDDAMCRDCHAERDIGSYRDNPGNKGSHPIDLQGSLTCSSCHQVHFAYTGGAYPQGDGYLLKQANDDNLCMNCHDTYGPHMGMGCRKCHKPHDPNKQNILLVKDRIWTPNSGQKNVRFYSETGAFSFADGDNTYDGICEICHTQTNHFRNDGSGPTQNHENFAGGYAGANCTDCHLHKNAFLHGSGGTGCIECHGHDKDFEYEPGLFSAGAGTSQSHSTHTEDDADDIRGPLLVCADCHDTNNFPTFADGQDLTNTTVCDACHSADGAFDGLSSVNGSIGAKDNWKTGVYTATDSLQTGKEKWCVGCHDQGSSTIEGVSAPPVAGDNSVWGYYAKGHGLNNKAICSDCHDLSTDHLDGEPRTYSSGSNNYTAGYRLRSDLTLLVPNPQGTKNITESDYNLCWQSCHTLNALLNNTNFSKGMGGKSLHQKHLKENARNREGWQSDWSVPLDSPNSDSRVTCPACHNMHGSDNNYQVRDGRLTNGNGNIGFTGGGGSGTCSGQYCHGNESYGGGMGGGINHKDLLYSPADSSRR